MKKTKWISRAKFLAAVTFGVLVALVVKNFLISVLWVPSDSMVPTLKVGDRLILVRFDRGLKAGDIIAFNPLGTFAQKGDPSVFLKRVIALPGQEVQCCDSKGNVTVDGAALDEGYINNPTSPFGPVRLKEGEIWVMGDNRAVSSDSRMRGPLEEKYVLGKVKARVWPLGEASWFS